MKWRAVFLVVVIGAMLGALIYSQNKKLPNQISGIIEADEIRVGSRLGGRVAEVLVEEGQAVKTGDVLLRLEPFDLRERLAEAQSILAARKADYDKMQSGLRPQEISQARARVDRTKALLEKLRAGPLPEEISAARSRLQLAQAQLQRARNSHERTMQLLNRGGGAVTREEVDQAVEGLKVAESTEQVRKEELGLLEKGTRSEDISVAEAELSQSVQAMELAELGFRKEEIEQAHQIMLAAEAAVKAIELQLKELEVHSGVDGIVDAMQLRPGDLVPPNGPVLTLLDMSRLWIRAYVPENQLDLQLGQVFEATVDSFPGKVFPAELTYVAERGEFTPRNAQTIEERSKQVFRVKLQIQQDSEGLRPGMSADVRLDRRLSRPSRFRRAP